MERRDSKGRNLRQGEVQMKDGRYRFSWTDNIGIRHDSYSWRLTKADPVPPGKRPCEALRDVEKRIQKDLLNGITPGGADITLGEAVRKYLDERRHELRPHTLRGYETVYRNHLKGKQIEKKRLGSIKYGDIKALYMEMANKGLGLPSIKLLNSLLNPVFQTAFLNGEIATNPTALAMADIRKMYKGKSKKVHALTREEQAELVTFTRDSARYSEKLAIVITFIGTGLRSGELSGLQWEDVDFKSGMITVNKQMTVIKEASGEHEKHISETKTGAGARLVPILGEVRDVLMDEREAQRARGGCCDDVDGYDNFVFTDEAGKSYKPNSISMLVRRIASIHDRYEAAIAEAEGRDPVLIGNIGAHVLRHSFCTRCSEAGMDARTLQEIAGHANIQVTLGTYTDVTADHAKAEMAALEGKIF